MRPCRTHTQRAVRGTAAILLTCSLLTAQAWAAKITPSATSVTLASNQKTFTVDVALSEETAFAGAEFGLDLPAGVTLTNVEFLDKAVQDANHSPEVTVEDRTFFGFYTAENTFSGDIKVARLTFSYTGDDAAAFGSARPRSLPCRRTAQPKATPLQSRLPSKSPARAALLRAAVLPAPNRC